MPELVLAPLLGITTATFRRAFFSLFGDWSGAVAPFIATTSGKAAHPRRFKDIYPESNRWIKPGGPWLEPQLIGKSGSDFADNARRIRDDWGYTRINWNIGCPSGTVTAKDRGAGILDNPGLVDSFLEQACSRFDGEITVKMRLGMYQDHEWQALAPILNRYPLAAITVHARTGIQQYKGRALISRFADFLKELKAPVFYNGDVNTLDAALMILGRFPGLKGIMMGRGALANPLLAQEIRHALRHGKAVGMGHPDLMPLLPAWGTMDVALKRRYHDAVFNAYLHEEAEHPGAALVLGRMKELWSHWTVWFMDPREEGADRDKAERVVSRILKARSVEDYLTAIDKAQTVLY